MAYELKPAASPCSIKEQEWSAGPHIQFSTFTSCLGVIAKVAARNSVIGIHLVLIDAFGECFSVADVKSVLAVLREQRYDPQSVHIVGGIGAWRSDKKSAEACEELERVLEPSWEDIADAGMLDVGFKGRSMEFTYTYAEGNYKPFRFYFSPEEPERQARAEPDPLSAAIAYPAAYPRLRARTI